MDDRTIANISLCPSCGAPLAPGTRFCENCGAPVPARSGGGQQQGGQQWQQPPRQQPWQEPDQWDPYDQWDSGQEEELRGGSGGRNDTLKWVLIGVGVGLAVLILVFGTIYLMKAADDEKEETEAQTTEETVEETTEAAADDSNVQDRSYGDEGYQDPGYEDPGLGQPNYQNGASTLSDIYITEDDLYDPYAPEFFPDSSVRYLSESEVMYLNEDQLQKAINDIYARNGREFKTPLYRNYYSNQAWYSNWGYGDKEAAANFNDYEKANVKLLTQYK